MEYLTFEQFCRGCTAKEREALVIFLATYRSMATIQALSRPASDAEKAAHAEARRKLEIEQFGAPLDNSEAGRAALRGSNDGSEG